MLLNNNFKFLLVIIFLFLSVISCKKNSTEISPVLTSGRATLNSNVENNKIHGFSFSNGEVISMPNSEGIIPDMILAVQISNSDVIGVFFGSVELRPSFHLISWVSTEDSAQTIFNNLMEIPDTTFQDLAIPVKKNQVWAVKSHENKYAKLLIIQTIAFNDSTNLDAITPYGEATFDWEFQPNGSRVF
jgi:hypothetical protein